VSVDFLAVQKAMRAWVVAGSGLPLDSVYWGQQDSKRVAEPAIEMRLLATHPLGLHWLDTETAFVTLAPIAVTSTDPSLNTFTAVAHGLQTGDGPLLVVGSAAIPADIEYWAIRNDANTFRLAAMYTATGGLDVSGAPSGNPITPLDLTLTEALTIEGTDHTLRAGEELRMVARGIERVSLTLECHTSAAVGMGAALAILSRIKARQTLPSQQAILHQAHIGLTDVERARAIHGVRNAVMFEPRAIMEIYFSMPTEESEFLQIIERFEVSPA
jgi:hypothetical protein